MGKYDNEVILTIDSSTNTNGFCVYSDKTLQIYGFITPPNKMDYMQRIMYIADEFEKIKKVYNPTIVVAEAGIVRNKLGSIKIAHGLGALMRVFKESPFYLVNNQTWKKTILGKSGKSDDKERAKEIIEKMWKVNIEKLDTSDAIGILTHVILSESI